MRNKKIVFKLKHLYESDPVDRLRGVNIVHALAQRGWDAALYDNQKEIDIIVYLGDDLYDKIINKHIRAKKVVQDLQDDPFNGVASAFMQKVNKEGLWDKIALRLGEGWYYGVLQLLLKFLWKRAYKEYIKSCDAVIASSLGLRESVVRYNQKCVYIPDAITPKLPPKQNHESQRVRIGWVGTVNNIGYLLLVNEALAAVQSRFGAEIVLITSPQIYNDLNLRAILGQFRFDFRFVAWSQESVERDLQECDIAIAPLPKGAAKSSNKILTYMSLGVACVCSGSQDYKMLAQEQSVRFLEDNTQESWQNALEELITDTPKRAQMAQNGFRLSQNYTIDALIDRYEALFEQL